MREIVYDILTTDNELTIYDSKSLNWSSFKFSNKYKKHTLSQEDILRPYLVSLQYYGTIDYEDVLLMINNIEDIFEVLPETEILIPELTELQNFILENKK